MQSESRKARSLLPFFLVFSLEFIINNLAHPVTPAIIKNLHLGDYMFGLAFASMAVTNFLFSPFWGKISRRMRTSTAMALSCAGYAVGQALFMLAKSELAIVVARAFAGAFAAGYMTISMIYTADSSPAGKGGRNLTILATINVVASAFGYLLGGVLGDVSIRLCFLVQIFGMAGCGLLFFTVLRRREDVPQKEPQTLGALVREANPFSAFLAIRPYLCRALVTLFGAILCAFIAYNAFEQCFNYYMIDQYGFSTSYNGAVKAATGIVSLLANLTVCMAILRRKRIDLPTALLLALCAASTLLMLQMPTLGLFLAAAMLFFGCAAVFQPLLQEQVAARSRALSEGSGVVMGFYNAVKSLGMIAGALTAGFLYGLSPDFPFFLAALFFALACLLALLYNRLHRRENSAETID